MKELEIELKQQTRKVRLSHFLKKRPAADHLFEYLNQLDGLYMTTRTTIAYTGSINDMMNIHSFFRGVNERLAMGTLFCGHFEDCQVRSRNTRSFAIPVIGKVLKGSDFLLHRVFPKTRPLDKLYFAFTRGRNRRLSKAEVLGRLISAGFEIVKVEELNKLTYFTVRKVGNPVDTSNVSRGWLYRMPRIGREGKIIHVYKMRTMHPYSEFLQDYLKNKNGYGENGKIRDDFRMTSWGRFMRRYWIDELPQIINLLKGDLKIVGVRPISTSYFNDIPEDLQRLRIQQKPGCIPPYVAMNRAGSVSSVLNAEKEYLEISSNSPVITDIKYFCFALYNIVVKRKRSA